MSSKLSSLNKKTKNSLTFLVPAFNEELNIENTIRKINSYALKNIREYEIIVVDDGSTDFTSQIVESLISEFKHLKLIRHASNQGIGSAFHSGIKVSKCYYITVVAGDDELDLENVEEAFSYLGVANHIGTIKKRDYTKGMILRTLISFLYRYLICFILQLPVSDPHSLQIYKISSLRNINLKEKGFFFAIEALIKLRLSKEDLVSTEPIIKLKKRPNERSNSFQINIFLSLINFLFSFRDYGRIFSLMVTSVALISVASSIFILDGIDSFQYVYSSNSLSIFLYNVIKILIVPIVCILPLALGMVLFGRKEEQNLYADETNPKFIYYFGAGYCALIALGVLFGSLSILSLQSVLTSILIILGFVVIWRPNLMRASYKDLMMLFSYNCKPTYYAKIFLIISLIFFYICIVTPVTFKLDTIQIYHPFLLRVIEDGSFWVTNKSLDVSNFLISRGAGVHLFFAQVSDQFIGTIIGGVCIIGGYLTLTSIAIKILNIFCKSQQLKNVYEKIFLGAGIWLSTLNVEIEKYHPQTFFLVMLLFLAIISQIFEKNFFTKKLSLSLGCITSFVIPITFPQHSVFIAIIMISGGFIALLINDLKLLNNIFLQSLCSVLGFGISVGINFFHLGIFALYPLDIFFPISDMAKFTTLSSWEIWDYLEQLQMQVLENKYKDLNLLHWIKNILLKAYHSLGLNFIDGKVFLEIFCVLFGIICFFQWLRARVLIGPAIAIMLSLTATFFVNMVFGVETTYIIILKTLGVSILGVSLAMFTFKLSDSKSVFILDFLVQKPFIAIVLFLSISQLTFSVLYDYYGAASLYRLMNYFNFGGFLFVSLLISLCVATYRIVPLKVKIDNSSSNLKQTYQKFKNHITLIGAVNLLFIYFIIDIKNQNNNFIDFSKDISFYAILFNISYLVAFLYFHFLQRNLTIDKFSRLIVPINRSGFLLSLLLMLTSIILYQSHFIDNPKSYTKRLEYFFGANSFANIRNDNDMFERCAEIASYAKDGKSIVTLNNLQFTIPCFADTRFPGKFVHHYNGKIGLHFKKLMSNDLKLIYTTFKNSGVDYFILFKEANKHGHISISNFFGVGFSKIFEHPFNIEFFDVVKETEDYIMLTWRSKFGKTLSSSQSYEVDQAIRSSQNNYRNMPQRNILNNNKLDNWIKSLFGLLIN